MKRIIYGIDFRWWSTHLLPYRRIWRTAMVLTAILVVGMIGYMLIERWGLPEAFYMTIITLSTVGFQEVHPLSQGGRIFTAFLIVIGIGTVGYAFGNIAAFFIEGELKELFRARKMQKDIERLHDHIILCGYGHEGMHAAEELSRNHVPFVIIERDKDLAEKLANEGALVVHGDATQDDILLSAGVAVARGLIATLSDDSDNVFVSLTARGFNPSLTIVARAVDETAVAKLIRAGANKVISSSEIGGRRMASVILRPKVVNFLDVIMTDQQLALRLEEIDITESSPFVGKSISDLQIRRRTGALVIAYYRQGYPIQVNPAADTILISGDVLIVMGNDEQVTQLSSILNS